MELFFFLRIRLWFHRVEVVFSFLFVTTILQYKRKKKVFFLDY